MSTRTARRGSIAGARRRVAAVVTGVTRATMSFGDDKPTDDLVGVPAGTTLTDVTGNQYFDTANVTITGNRYLGRVTVRAAGVTFRNCYFAGPTSATADTACVDATNAACATLVLEDCTIKPQAPSYWINGVNGHDFTLRRCLITNCVDGSGVYNTTIPSASRPYNSGVVIEGNIAEDPAFFSVPTSVHPDGYTHNDTLCQIQGGRGTVIRGNLVRAYRATDIGEQGDGGQYTGGRVLSCVLFNNNVGDSANSIIDRNWFEGAVLPIEGAGASPTDVGDITGNRFDGTTGSSADINLASAQKGVVVVTDNVRYDGTAARVPYNG